MESGNLSKTLFTDSSGGMKLIEASPKENNKKPTNPSWRGERTLMIIEDIYTEDNLIAANKEIDSLNEERVEVPTETSFLQKETLSNVGLGYSNKLCDRYTSIKFDENGIATAETLNDLHNEYNLARPALRQMMGEGINKMSQKLNWQSVSIPILVVILRYKLDQNAPVIKGLLWHHDTLGTLAMTSIITLDAAVFRGGFNRIS